MRSEHANTKPSVDSRERISELRAAAAKAPSDHQALLDLGDALFAADRREEALGIFLRAAAMRPDCAGSSLRVARTLYSRGIFDGAVQWFSRAKSLNTEAEIDYYAWGHALVRLEMLPEAEAVFQEWLERSPHDPAARHLSAACLGKDVPIRCSDAYVRQTFDNFAETFDARLGRLRYQGPELIEHVLREIQVPADGSLHVLDIGCGTGLGAPFLRPYASRLVGVDLSPKMLEKARQRGGFDELHEMEITTFLGRHSREFDLITAADTLIYFGDLDELFSAARTALRERGLLAVTIEAWDDPQGERPYRLYHAGRYQHGAIYLRESFERAGFSVVAARDADLRLEAGYPVPGVVAVGRLQ